MAASTSGVQQHPKQPSDVAAGIVKDKMHRHNHLACKVLKRNSASCSVLTSAVHFEDLSLLEMLETLGFPSSP